MPRPLRASPVKAGQRYALNGTAWHGVKACERLQQQGANLQFQHCDERSSQTPYRRFVLPGEVLAYRAKLVNLHDFGAQQ